MVRAQDAASDIATTDLGSGLALLQVAGANVIAMRGDAALEIGGRRIDYGYLPEGWNRDANRRSARRTRI